MEALQALGFSSAQDTRILNYVEEALRTAFASSTVGTSLLMLQTVELTEEGIPERYRVQLRGLFYAQNFPNESEALQKTLRWDCGSDERILEENSVQLVELLVVSNSLHAIGQLNHPRNLLEQIEAVVAAASRVEDSEAVAFLRALESACLRAERKTAKIAGVAIRDVVGADGRKLEFEPFFAADENAFRMEEVSRRSSATCEKIEITIQDLPVGVNQ